MRDMTIDIPPNNPFENDYFKRKIIAENFMKIFEKDEEGMVLAIDSDWGTGKTTFIKMWESLINNNDIYKDNYETVYFNAWDNDYMEDPLLALFTEVQLKKKSEDITSEVFNEIFSPMLIGVKRFVDIGLKLKSSGAVGIEDFNLKKDLKQNEVENEMASMGDEVLNRAIYARELRDNFRKKIELFQKQDNDTEKNKKKVIFFIDELDRCRPKFAIELLETIKHLFSVRGVIFVISLDKKQLSHSVATVYGQNMDTIGYLRRFFDLEYRIPTPDKKIYLDIKNKAYLNKYQDTKYLELFLKSFMNEFDFSLRDIDKSYFYIERLLPLIPEYNGLAIYNEALLAVRAYLYAYMVCIKIKYEDLYKKIMSIDYKNDDSEIEREFMINTLRNIDFRSEKDYIYRSEALDNVLLYYLKLNYLCSKSTGLSRISEDDFRISLKSYSECYMTELFDSSYGSIISKDLEFVSNFEGK